MNETTAILEETAGTNKVQTLAPYPNRRTNTQITPQSGGASCGCGGNGNSTANGAEAPSYISTFAAH